MFCILGNLSKVRNVEVKPIQYEESNAVTVSWQPPQDLGGNKISDIVYEVSSCFVNSNNCKNYGNITLTKQEMKGFNRENNQIYTYHITPFGKNGTKGGELIGVITFQDRGQKLLISTLFLCNFLLFTPSHEY